MCENLRLENFNSVLLAGGGEPLINRDVVEMLRYLHESYPHVKISFTSNGISLSEKMAQVLIDANVHNINISVNAATAETHQRIMQVTSFDVVCENIKRFARMIKEQGSGLRIRLSSALNTINIRELPDLVRLTKELGADQVNAMYCRFYPQEIRHQTPLFNIEDKLDDEHSLFYHQELSDSMVKEAACVARDIGIILTHEPLFEAHAGVIPCTSAKNILMVGWDGEVYPCGGAELHMKKKVEAGNYHFGNALKEPLEEFWNNENYCKLRISAEQTNEFHVPECSECANVFDANKESCHMMQWKQFDHTPISLSSLRVKAARRAGAS